jgi:MYXO-CTERM domain-containing protein
MSARRLGCARLTAASALLIGFFGTTHVNAQPVPITVVLQDGDTPAGAPGPVQALRNPTTNTLGQVGFTGVAGNVQFVWIDNGIVWLDTDETTMVLAFSDNNRMGISDAGGFAYGPSVDGDEAVWTDAGLFFRGGTPAPGITNGVILTIESPMMLPSGDVWVNMNVDTNNDLQTDVEALFQAPAGMPSGATMVLATGDLIGMVPIAPFGLDDYNWNVSRNGAHHIVQVDLQTFSTTSNEAILVDGAIAAQEGTTTGAGDSWLNFLSGVSINDSGNHLIGAQTDGPTTTDLVIAYNGTVALREEDMVGTTVVDGFVHAVALTNGGSAAFIWGSSTATEVLYAACDASDLANTSRVVLSTGDQVDVDNDAMPDAQLIDFQAENQGNQSGAGPAMTLADDGWAFAEVFLDYGQGPVEAVIRVDVACCGDGSVGGNEECDDMMESAMCDADCTEALCGDLTVNDMAGEDCDEGGVESAACDADCTAVACGDGTVNATVMEQCDDGGASATCDTDCTPAECGDMLVNMVAGEQCEDGNTVDGDGCSSTCQLEGETGAGGAATTSASGGPTSGAGGGAGGAGGNPSDFRVDSGCGCRTAGSSQREAWVAALALALAFVRRRRR